MQGRDLSLNLELWFEEPVTKPDECWPLKIAEGLKMTLLLYIMCQKDYLGCSPDWGNVGAFMSSRKKSGKLPVLDFRFS